MDFKTLLRRTKLENNNYTIKALRKIMAKEGKECTDINQLWLRLWDVLDYMEGNKTPEYNNKIEKKYENIGMDIGE